MAISISLEDLLHSDAPLSREQIYTIDQGFVEGVSYLHRNGIIHRDLRSANILIDVDHHCHPYISDFGLSEIKAEDDNPRARTSKGSRVIIGSPAWMAPELFKNWPCSKQSDFYSIGVILWETITRRYPFEGIDRQEIIKKVWKGEREKIPNNVPKHYAKLIQQCWQQAPEQRPKDAIYIARALRLFKLHLAKETEQGQEQGQFLSQKL